MLSILTIGHSNHSAGKFAGLVAAHAIEVVADTRTYPYSRFSPQFNSGRLRALLAAHGVRYLYLGKELGGRVRAEPQVFASGVARLIEEAASRRVTVLCAEEDPNRCHRRLLITPALVERGVRVLHIRGDGRVESEEELARAEAPLYEQSRSHVHPDRTTSVTKQS